MLIEQQKHEGKVCFMYFYNVNIFIFFLKCSSWSQVELLKVEPKLQPIVLHGENSAGAGSNALAKLTDRRVLAKVVMI